MLTFALLALFAITAISVICTLVDSALRARNAYGELAQSVAAGDAAPKIRLIQHAEISELPALRTGPSRTIAAARYAARGGRRRVSAVA